LNLTAKSDADVTAGPALSVAEACDAVGARCPHCGAAVEGAQDEFCCHGCELAWTIIHGAGLQRYYDERTSFAPRPQPARFSWEAVPVQTAPDGTANAKLMIDGLRCASCVWVTERVLERMPGVCDATVSYATGRTTLRWDPNRVNLPALAGTISSLGYRPRLLGEESSPDRELLPRVGVATFAAMNIMLVSVSLYAGWFSSMEPRFVVLLQWASLALATPVALWAADPFYKGAWGGLKNGVLHMDVPIAIAIVVLYVHGFVATLTHRDAYLDSLAMLVALLLAGRMLESRGRRRAAEAATALAATAPATARRRTEGGVETIATAELRVGDLVDVGSGQEVPADGELVEGGALVMRSMVTGEATPVAAGPGDKLLAGSLVEDGAVTLRVEQTGADTMLGRMASDVRAAADRGVGVTSADRMAPWFTAATLTIAIATFLWWWMAEGVGQGIITSVAVLVVACPCALALARPLGAVAGLGAAARRGLMVRSADPLLSMANIDLAALDKTGTVTEGALEVVDACNEAIRIASGLERYSVHPAATAILSEANRRRIPISRATNVSEVAGEGISGLVDDRRWKLRRGDAGSVQLESDEGEIHTIRMGDTLRADTPAAIRSLEALGVEVVLLSGDHVEVANGIANAAGITRVFAEFDPQQKRRWIHERRSEGRKVLFAGDGLNDGPGIAEADVGIAMGTGAASSVLVADGVIAGGSLKALLAGIRAARACHHTIRVNEIRSIVYNVTAVAAAVLGFVNPLVAAVLMPLSSGVVIWSASRIESRVAQAEAA
jgi:Cu2+-exporting ATPase